MSDEKFNKEDLLKEIKQLITDSTKESVTEKELNSRVSEINSKLEELNNKEDNHEEVAGLKNSIDELVEKMNQNSIELKALREEGMGSGKETPKNIRDLMKEAIMGKKDIFLKKKNDDYGERFSMKEWFTEKGNQNSPTFTLKSAVDMLQSNIVQNYVSYQRLSELDPNRVSIPLTIYPHVLTSMSVKRTNKPYMALLVAYTYVDGSGTKTEGSASSKSSVLFKTVNFPTFTIATYATLSNETLDDLEEALDELSVVVPDKLMDSLDGKILSTAGDDSTDIAGLFTANKMTAFAATWDGTIPNATIVDLIAHMKLQAEGNKYKPDQVWLNPTDIVALTALKNDISDSVQDRRVVWGANGVPTAVCGLQVMPNTNVTADTCAVVDSKQTWIGLRKDITMTMGYNGTDLTEGQKTVVFEMRAAFGVRDKAGVIYSSGIATDVTAITKSA